MISIATHKDISEIKTIDDLKKIFPDAKCDMCNFVLFSTGGVHGSYTELDVIQECMEILKEDDDDYTDHLTVLIVQPRVVSLRYGHIKISLDDIEYLEQLRESSKKAVMKFFT